MSDRVSPSQGQGSLDSQNVTLPPALSHRSRPVLHSRFRGPFLYNETDEERQRREEAERKKEEDEGKRSNFDKVRQKAEAEEAARKAAEAERDALLQEKAAREAQDRKAADEKLAAEKQFEQLAAQKQAEAEAKAAEAQAEREKRVAAEAELNEFKAAQQVELDALLTSIPEKKRPPLDDSMTVAQKLKLVKYAKEQLGGPKPSVGGGLNGEAPEKQARISELQRKPQLTSDEAFELASLSGEES